MQLAGLDVSLHFGQLLSGTGSAGSLIDVGQLDGTGLDGAGPVGGNGLAVLDAVHNVLIVGSPVDPGGHQEGVGAGADGGTVVGHVGHTGGLAGSGSAHGVGVLGNQLGTAGDQLVGGFLLGGFIIPGTGEGDIHGDGGADGLGAQVEAGITGLNLGVGESADVAHLCFLSGEFTCFDHLVQLQTSNHTGQVTALVDGGEGIVVVAQALGVGLGAGGVAELDLGELLGSLDHIVLMAKGVGEDDVAARIRQFAGSVVALLTFGDVGAEDVLIFAQAQVGHGFLDAVHEVQVVGGVFVVQEDEAQLHVCNGSGNLSLRGSSLVICRGSSSGGSGSLGLAAAGSQAQDHNKNQCQRKNLFHFLFSS